MSLQNLEIEFKYIAKADLSAFQDFCEKRNAERFQIVSGFDHFYSKSAEPSSFYRHRVNTNENQLTFKKKTVDDNSYIREEHNIDLPLTVSREKIQALCNINGYLYDFSIFKNCFIYSYDYYTLVFYVCYDTQLKELGRFVEIEMKEDYNWSTEEEAYGELVTLERLCKNLGLSPELRVKLSLYEQFRSKK